MRVYQPESLIVTGELEKVDLKWRVYQPEGVIVTGALEKVDLNGESINQRTLLSLGNWEK